MKHDVRLVVKPGSVQDVGMVLGELDEIGEVAEAHVIVDVHLVVEAETTEDACHGALRLVERAVTYADDVWLADKPEERAESREAG